MTSKVKIGVPVSPQSALQQVRVLLTSEQFTVNTL